MKNVTDYREIEDDAVGYRKPPKSRQFKKGVSGNPLGRPKKSSDFGSQLIRELESGLTINESGNRRVIKKYEGVVKQLVNKAVSGNLPATRLLITLHKEALERAAEQQRRSPLSPDRRLDELTDEELTAIIRAGFKNSAQDDTKGLEVIELLSSAEADI